MLKPSVIDVLDAPGSGRKNLEQLFDLWEQAALAPGFNGCLVGNSVSELGLRDAELAHALGRKFELLEAALLRALVRARRAGEVSMSAVALVEGARVTRDEGRCRNAACSQVATARAASRWIFTPFPSGASWY